MRIRLPATLVVLLVLVAAAPAAWAAEEGGLDLKEQLSWPTILTSIVVFLLLLVVLAKTAWKPILAGLQRREETIRKALDDAEAAHEKAKALIAEYEGRLDHARTEAQAIFDEARKDADAMRAQLEAEARARGDEIIDRAQREIDQRAAKAWDELVRDAAAIACETAGRIIGQTLDPEGHAAIVGQVVDEFAASRERSGAGDAS
jgi:F-type H+-transporting ATPase subunit b